MRNKERDNRFSPIRLHFRFNKWSKHKALIGGETLDGKRYAYMTLTHDPYSARRKSGSGRKQNLQLKHNPDPSDSNPSYLRKQVCFDDKNHFDYLKHRLILDPEDAKELSEWFLNNPNCCK